MGKSTMVVPDGRDLRQDILESARQLFITHGYHGLPMRQISESVGVTKAALYYHFKDKEQLFLAVMEQAVDEISPLIDQAMQSTPDCVQRITLFIQSVLSLPPELRAVIRLASQEMGQLSESAREAFNRFYYERFIGRIETILDEGVACGEIRPVDTHLATWTLLGMMYPYFYPSHSDDVQMSREAIEQLTSIYLFGVRMIA